MSVRTTVWLTDEQSRLLKARSESLGMTQSQVIREIFDLVLQTGGPAVERGWRAGFLHGIGLVMNNVNRGLKDLELQFQAGTLPIPDLADEPANTFNG